MKTREELVKYMWEKYPDVPKNKKKDIMHMDRRQAMLEAFKFLSGEVDREERERAKLAKSIYDRIITKGH